MEWKTLAIVEIDFNKKELTEENTQPLEEFLKKFENIDNLIILKNRLTFYMGSHEKINYNLLVDLKEKLKSLGYIDFEVFAKEYIENGIKYHYFPDQDNS